MRDYCKELLLFSIFVFGSIAPAVAQKTSAKSNPQSDLTRNLIEATKEYKESLTALVSAYDTNATRVDKKVAQMKELFDEGLVSKRDYELVVAEAAEAHAKTDVTRKQIAAADGMMADAQKPQTAPGGGTVAVNGSRNISWTTGNSRYDSLIRQNGTKFGVDPYLIFCVMEQESHFNSSAASPKGAQGLMQLMPDTATRFGVANILDPAQSIMGGTRYLKQLLQMFGGRVDLALASYNAGEGAVQKFGGKIPPYRETIAYVRAIGTRYGLLAK